MKYFVILLIFVGSVMLAPNAFAWCPQNEDWPDRPCYAAYQDFGIEKERSDWEPYYDYKGSEWMESKKNEMIQAIQNDTLSDWIESTSKTQAHRNVYEYYFIFGEVPNSEGEFIDESYVPVESVEKYQFIDFPYANIIGEPIKFILEKTSYNNCNSFNAEITDKEGNVVWGEGAFALCDPTNTILSTSQIKIGYNKDNPLIINESGKYFIEIKMDNIITKREFIVRQNYVGANLDDTDYSNSREFLSPLKQVKDGVPINLIKCNESLNLEWKRDLQPICVTSETAGELIKRGVIKLRLGMPAENMTQERLCVWYPENPLIQRHCDWETNILFTFKDEGLVPAYDEILRLYAMEKRQLFRDFQSDAREKYGPEHMWELLPSHYRGYDYHREALEFGIHHEVFDEESAPKHVEFIRSIVGENVNLTVRPAYPIVPQSFPTEEFFDD